ncbi:Leucine-rich repeat receptor protein kinase EMS1, partial [Mucuna pruriens]
MLEREVITRISLADIYNPKVLLMWKGQESVFLRPQYLPKSIDFSSNDLTGEVPKEVGYLLGLISLNISRNNLHGEIPSGIGNLNWLEFLDLSSNHFTGKIPSTLSKIDSLGVLDLSNNNLSGRIPWEGHLETFDASKFEGNLELCGEPLNRSCPGDKTTVEPQGQTVDGEDDNSVLYEALYMSLGLGFFAGFWGLLGPILLCQPWRNAYGRFLNRITDYILVIFEANDQAKSANKVILRGLRRLMGDGLSSCRKCCGHLHPIQQLRKSLTVWQSAWTLSSQSQAEGGIPTILSQADTLDLSKNKISDLKTFLCEKSTTTNLGILDLSNNQIMGQLPDCWEHLNPSLQIIDLSNNRLSGKIPQSMGTLLNLRVLVLQNNSLTGKIPLSNCTYLFILDASENLLSGPIPSWIVESVQQLEILSLQVNNLFGSIPVHLCYLRRVLVLDHSRNNLSGGIPTCLRNLTAMMERRVIREYVFLYPEYLLKIIDFSSNDLAGQVPKEVGYLHGLVSLNLSRNNLHGEIPSEIGNLNWLEFLDLSRNHLTGKIPSTLSKIDSLGVLDLSNNNLSGRIPWEGYLETFDASSFEGNIGLCGQQLNKSCPGDETIAKPQEQAVHGEDDNSIFYKALYMSLGLGFFAGFWGLLGPILLCQPWRNAYDGLNRLTDYILVMVQVNVAKCHRWLKWLYSKVQFCVSWLSTLADKNQFISNEKRWRQSFIGVKSNQRQGIYPSTTAVRKITLQ